MNDEKRITNNEYASAKIISFTDLRAWQEGHRLVLEIYRLTKLFPKEEQYALIDQLRRAGISIVSNIAEGFSRHSYKEKTQFYYMSRGSVTEIQSQLLIARDLRYITKEQFDTIAKLAITVHKIITALIISSKKKL